MDDREKELARIDQELLEEVLKEEEEEKKQSQPAFENPDEIHDPEQPMVYCNYSNDYGKELEDFAENDAEEPVSYKQKRDDKILIALMITASVLCLGILGMLMYWMELFFA